MNEHDPGFLAGLDETPGEIKQEVAQTHYDYEVLQGRIQPTWKLDILRCFRETSKLASNSQSAHKKLIVVLIKLSRQWNFEQFQGKLYHKSVW